MLALFAAESKGRGTKSKDDGVASKRRARIMASKRNRGSIFVEEQEECVRRSVWSVIDIEEQRWEL